MATKPEFDDLVETYREEIFSYLWRILQISEEAEDCLQETFLKAYVAYGRFKWPGNPRAWLYRIATNTAFTRLKREKTARNKRVQLAATQPQVTPSVADQAESRWLLDEIRAAVEDLPAQQRSALLMRKYQELTYKEISLALDCSPEAARANVYQGLRKLRQQFANPVENEVIP